MGNVSGTQVGDCNASSTKRKAEEAVNQVEVLIPDERKRQSFNLRPFHIESPIRMQLRKQNSSTKEDCPKIKILEGDLAKLKASRDCLDAEKNRLVRLVQKLQQELHETKLSRSATQRTVNVLLNEVHALKLQLRLSRTRLVNQYPCDSSEQSTAGSLEEIPLPNNIASFVDSTASSETVTTSQSNINTESCVEGIGPVLRLVALVGHDLLNTANGVLTTLMTDICGLVDGSHRLVDYDIISVNSLRPCPTDLSTSNIVVAFPGALSNMNRQLCDWVVSGVLECGTCVKAILLKTAHFEGGGRISRREEAVWIRVSRMKKCHSFVVQNGDVYKSIADILIPFLKCHLPPQKLDASMWNDRQLALLGGALGGVMYASHGTYSIIQDEILRNKLISCEPWVKRRQLQDIYSFIANGNEHNSLLISHQSGSGVSSMLAKIIQQKLDEPENRILYEFVEDDVRCLLTDCKLMMQRFTKLLAINDNNQSAFSNILAKAAQTCTSLIIIVDGIDLMLANYQGILPEWLRWILAPLPSNCRLIMSCKAMPQDLRSMQHLEIGPMSNSETVSFIREIVEDRESLVELLSHKISLPSLKIILVTKAITKYIASLSSFKARLYFHFPKFLSVFRVECELDSIMSTDTNCLAIIRNLLTRIPQILCSLSYEDMQVVWKVLGLIATSRNGLSRIELEQLEPRVVLLWNKFVPTLLTFCGGILQRVIGLYSFTNALWREAVDDLLDCSVISIQLISYWTSSSLCITWRSVDECIWLMSKSTSLASYLTQPHVFISLYSRNYTSQIHNAWARTQNPEAYIHSLIRENQSSHSGVFLLACCIFAVEEGPLDDSALVVSHSAIERIQSCSGVETSIASVALLCCSLVHSRLSRFLPAGKYCKRGLNIATKLYGTDHILVQCLLLQMVQILSSQKKMKAAECVHNRLVDICARNCSCVLNLSNGNNQYSLKKALAAIHQLDGTIPIIDTSRV